MSVPRKPLNVGSIWSTISIVKHANILTNILRTWKIVGERFVSILDLR